jgi:hypothetical protein
MPLSSVSGLAEKIRKLKHRARRKSATPQMDVSLLASRCLKMACWFLKSDAIQ